MSADDGAILYALVARDTLVLSSYTNPVVDSGNFPRIAVKILEKISPQNQKMAYAYDNFMFHFEVSDEVVFMCMSDDSFSKGQCFRYIADMKKEWQDMFGDRGKTATLANQMNKKFKSVLKQKMNFYNNDLEANKIKKARVQIEQIKDQMIENIDKVIERGEKMDILVSKTSDLGDNAIQFRKGSRNLSYKMLFNAIKIILLFVLLILCVALGVFLYFCSGIACIINLFK